MTGLSNEKPQFGILSTGVAGLDEILYGGQLEGQFYLVEGEPGTGKTTLSLQVLLEGARRGEPVLYISLSESEREIQRVARSHDWSLKGVSIYEYTPPQRSLNPDEQYSVFHPSDVEFHDATRSILKEVERVHPARAVIDALSEIRLLAGDALRYRRQILALKQYFANRNCTVLLLDDRTAETHDFQLESIAHESPRIHLSAARQGVSWRLSVADNGIGIAPEYHDKVFGVFNRLHSNNDRYAGTGIGLAICQKIVERYGGHIWIESEQGVGSVFHFTLPAASAEHMTQPLSALGSAP